MNFINFNDPTLKEYFRLPAPMQEHIRMVYEYNGILDDLRAYINMGVISSNSVTAAKMSHSATHVLLKHSDNETEDCSTCARLAKFE